MLSLNLGSGGDYRHGWVNYDQEALCDIRGDCEEGLPFRDETFTFVYASHILEHVHDLRKLKSELHRVMQLGGLLTVIVPYYLSPDAWGDDTHVRAFSNQSFFPDFWPGFSIDHLEHEKRVKTYTGEEVTWIIATIRKSSSESRRMTSRSGASL